MSGYDASEWKAGDVGILDYKFAKGGLAMRVDKCGDHEFRGPHWHFANGDRGDGSGAYRIRPLVVIDPEDAEQVERLNSAWIQAKSADLDDTPLSLGALRMRQALREFARPTPRIEEPQGLGAVVETEKGRRYVRLYGQADTPDYQCWKADVLTSRIRWSEIAEPVRILSPGVTP